MSSPYVGEIRMFGGSFAPAGWMLCDGQLIPISENDTLFNLIGTTYGGDGQETFALPNLQSRMPIHAGTGPAGITRQIGEAGGVESVTLTVNQIPAHSHPMVASTDPGTVPDPAGNIIANGGAVPMFRPFPGAAPTNQTFSPSVSSTGGNQPHENTHPFLCVNFIISLFGIFPTQN